MSHVITAIVVLVALIAASAIASTVRRYFQYRRDFAEAMEIRTAFRDFMFMRLDRQDEIAPTWAGMVRYETQACGCLQCVAGRERAAKEAN